MEFITQSIYKFADRFVQIISIALMVLLSISAFLLTCYADDMITQQALTKWDNLLVSLFGIICFVGLLYIFTKYITNKPQKRIPILLFGVMGWCLLLGAILIVFSKTAPAADAWSVYDIAQNLAMGNTGVIHPTDSYLSYYPQQVGLVAFLEVLIRFWNLLPLSLPAYHFIKCVYVVMLCFTIFFQYKTVHLLWKNDKADCIYLLLAATNLPWIMYTSFVYGEIPSFAMMSVGIYYLFKFLYTEQSNDAKRDPSNKASQPFMFRRYFTYGAISLFTLTFAVMLRKNSLVFIIAIIIVVLCHWLKTKPHGLLLYVALCILLSVSILPMVQKSMEHRAGNYLQAGVTPLSYFAMGMQESSRGNGWYNAFNFDTYQATGMDTEATNAISQKAITERLQYFDEHPDYAIHFYFQKYLTQWADGTYASRQATLATFGGRNEFFNQVYAGDYSKFFIGYCNIYQNVIYLACLLYFVREYINSKKQRQVQANSKGSPESTTAQSYDLATYLGMICVLGGFLFHMIWEANSRYIFLYSLMLLPYAAMGIVSLLETFSHLHPTSNTSKET